MIRTRTGKDPVTLPSQTAPVSIPSPSVTSATLSHRLLHRPAFHLHGLLRLARRRRTFAVALLAGSAAATAAATVTVTAAVNHVRAESVTPLAQARPVATAAEALKTQAALAPRIKRHPIADALHLKQFARFEHLSDLHPLRGIASWYGSVWHGHRTASGETFDEAGMTAAHRTLPLGTIVRVTNLRTLRSVIVRINDRGALAPGRVIDLTSAAAQEIGMLHAGTAQVKVEVLQNPAQS